MLGEQHSLPGELESRISRGAATKELLEANFQNRDLQDKTMVEDGLRAAKQYLKTVDTSFQPAPLSAHRSDWTTQLRVRYAHAPGLGANQL